MLNSREKVGHASQYKSPIHSDKHDTVHIFEQTQGKRIAKTVPSSDRIRHNDGENTAPHTD